MGLYMYRCIFECIHTHTYHIRVLQIIAFFSSPPASPCFFLTNEEVWKSAQEPWGPGLKLWIIFQPQDFLRFRKSQCYFKGKWAVWIYPHQPPHLLHWVCFFSSLSSEFQTKRPLCSAHTEGGLNRAPHLSCWLCGSPSKGRLAGKTVKTTKPRTKHLSRSPKCQPQFEYICTLI